MFIHCHFECALRGPMLYLCVKGKLGHFLAWTLFSHVFVSKWLMKTTIFHIGPVLRETATVAVVKHTHPIYTDLLISLWKRKRMIASTRILLQSGTYSYTFPQDCMWMYLNTLCAIGIVLSLLSDPCHQGAKHVSECYLKV